MELDVNDQYEIKATQHSSVNVHKQSKHGGVRHECDKCEYKTTQQSSLMYHKQAKHGGVRCDYSMIIEKAELRIMTLQIMLSQSQGNMKI